ncbi:MAG: low temperature requirement protein A [Pyrinomonadaceae bacterium]
MPEHPTANDQEKPHHHAQRMGGRDVHETHRVATPLELLFDLTFVIAFGIGASQFAHSIAEAHFATGLLGFGFATFAICWAWINFSWFASAYDTDDWVYRLTTMVQMVGVLILALGLPQMFASLENDVHLNNRIMVLGYVIMRVAMVFQWLRAAKQDPARRRTCLTYVKAITLAQFGWTILIFLDFSIAVTLAMATAFILVEMAGPYLAERIDGGTPWHAHHIAERYSLFTIIALGEGVVGTVAALSAVIESQGWTTDVALVGLAGMGLTFGMWWVYFMLPAAEVLHVHRERSFVFGYGLMITISSIVATGAGLHVAAYFIEHKAHIGPLGTVLSVAAPVVVFIASIYMMYAYLLAEFDRFHIWLLFGTLLVMAIAIIAAALGVSMPVCLIILSLAPAVTVIGYEVRGHKHHTDALAKNDLA